MMFHENSTGKIKEKSEIENSEIATTFQERKMHSTSI